MTAPTPTRLPARVAAAVLLLALVAAPLATASGGSGYLLAVSTRGAVLAIAAVSLQFMLGFANLVSFGHAATLCLGAYAVLASNGADALWVLPLAMAAAALFNALTGLVALRTAGVAYIMITLAFGQMAFFVAGAAESFGGDDGMPLDGRTPFAGAVPANRYAFHAAVLASLLLWAGLLRTLALSRFGRALRASAGNPVRTAALGFDNTRLRLVATRSAAPAAASPASGSPTPPSSSAPPSATGAAPARCSSPSSSAAASACPAPWTDACSAPPPPPPAWSRRRTGSPPSPPTAPC